jgi:hypothetical protein
MRGTRNSFPAAESASPPSNEVRCHRIELRGEARPPATREAGASALNVCGRAAHGCRRLLCVVEAAARVRSRGWLVDDNDVRAVVLAGENARVVREGGATRDPARNGDARRHPLQRVGTRRLRLRNGTEATRGPSVWAGVVFRKIATIQTPRKDALSTLKVYFYVFPI